MYYYLKVGIKYFVSVYWVYTWKIQFVHFDVKKKKKDFDFAFLRRYFEYSNVWLLIFFKYRFELLKKLRRLLKRANIYFINIYTRVMEFLHLSTKICKRKITLYVVISSWSMKKKCMKRDPWQRINIVIKKSYYLFINFPSAFDNFLGKCKNV